MCEVNPGQGVSLAEGHGLLGAGLGWCRPRFACGESSKPVGPAWESRPADRPGAGLLAGPMLMGLVGQVWPGSGPKKKRPNGPWAQQKE